MFAKNKHIYKWLLTCIATQKEDEWICVNVENLWKYERLMKHKSTIRLGKLWTSFCSILQALFSTNLFNKTIKSPKLVCILHVKKIKIKLWFLSFKKNTWLSYSKTFMVSPMQTTKLFEWALLERRLCISMNDYKYKASMNLCITWKFWHKHECFKLAMFSFKTNDLLLNGARYKAFPNKM